LKWPYLRDTYKLQYYEQANTMSKFYFEISQEKKKEKQRSRIRSKNNKIPIINVNKYLML
jgi:hypothetical protein